jgi:hypothetical protein
MGHVTMEHRGKYRALWEHLRARRDDEVTLTFAEVERILGFPLPASSRRYVQHWHGYGGSAVARAIADAGWRAKGTDLNAQRVTLYRLRR